MKRYLISIISLIVMMSFTGCMETNITDEEARKLPVCVETSENMYSMSQGTIGEVGDYYNQQLAHLHHFNQKSTKINTNSTIF